MASKRFKTIEAVVHSRLCLHCGTCINACPTNCIDQVEDQYGNPIPKVGKGCSDCGLCIEVCPGVKSDLTMKKEGFEHSDYLGTFNGTFIGRARSSVLSERQVASGGIVSAIAAQFFDAHPNGLVQWVSLSETGKPITRLLDLSAFKKSDGDSVYIPSFANRAFLDAESVAGGPILAVGLPCQIQGLELLKKHNSDLRKRVQCRISLFCGLSISTDAIEFLLKKADHRTNEVEHIRFRTESGLVVTLKNGKKLQLDKNSVNYSHMVERCALCPDHTGELADISCGDAWLSSFSKKSKLTWSVIITRSEIGMQWIRRAIKAKRLWAMRVEPEDVIASQRPMLHFKKRTLKQRYFLRSILRGNTPIYKGPDLQVNASPRALIGNLVLLNHLRFRHSRIYMELLTRFVKLSFFNRFIKFCLYLDVDYFFHSLRNNMNQIRSRIKALPYLSKSFKILRRKINDNIRQQKEKARFSEFRFDNEILLQWKKQFPESAAQVIVDAKDSKNGKLKLFDTVYNIKRYGWNTNPITNFGYPNYIEPLMGLWFRKSRKLEKYGDEKYTFELHKHYFFSELALAYRLTKEKEYVNVLYGYLRDWRKTALPNTGICWYGNIHVAQRMVSWIMTFLMLKNDKLLGKMVCDEIDRGLKEHAYILKSRYKYPANNHKIGALCALIIYELFRNKIDRKKPLDHYSRELESEVKRQIATNGAPGEGSLAYGRLVYEFLLLVVLFATSVDFELSEIIVERTKAMTKWFNKVLGPETVFPPIGDRSGERAFPFCESVYRETDCLAVGERTFNLDYTCSITPMAWLLLESSGLGIPKNFAALSDENSHFIDTTSGYARMSGKRKTGLWTVWMRAGNFGFPPKYGHSHSDFLGPVIFLDGNAVLTERGTFKYNVYTEDRLSDVLTEGHSGIRYNVFEQNSWRGTFEWAKQPLSAGLDSNNKDLSGWMKMPDNAVLSRRIRFSDKGLIITDKLLMADDKEKLIEWSFIVDGVVREERIDKEGIIVFRLRGNPGRVLHLFHDGISASNYELRPARIATGYGVSHNGSQILIRRLQNQSGTWTTRLNVVN